MKKKICRICGNEFEAELEETEVCPQCAADEEVSEALPEEDDNAVIENVEDNADDCVSESDYDCENDTNVENEENLAPLSDEEMMLALEEAAKLKEKKKKKLIKALGITVGVVAVVAAVLFVPFKKDKVFDREVTDVNVGAKTEFITRRTNLFNSIHSAITFAANPDVAMIIDGEKIDNRLFDYFYNIAQGKLVEEKGEDVIDDAEFWNSEETVESLKKNAKADFISFVSGMHRAKAEGLELSSEDEEQIDSYIESMGDDFLAELNLTKEHVKFILEGSQLTSQLCQNLISDDENFDISDEKVEVYVNAQGEKITAKHILFTSSELSGPYQNLSEDEKAAIEAEAKETLDRISAGEDFDTLMNELSKDPGLQQYPDGYTFGKGQMVKEFENAAYALNENEVSGIVETSVGLHIIKRVPLTLTASDISSAKREIQYDMFDDYIMKWAKSKSILTNDSYINSLKPTVYDSGSNQN